MTRNTVMIPLLALAVGLSQAPAGAQSPAGGTTSNGSPQNAPIPQTFTLIPPKNGSGQLQLNHNRSLPGQPVEIDFTIQNTSAKPVIYSYPSAQQFDMTVQNSHGQTVWDWARGQVFAQTLQSLSLKPGEKKTYHATWNGLDNQGKPVSPGTYTIKARMTSSNHPAVTGNLIVNTDTDPQNVGVPTRTPADNGVVREIYPNPPITASKTIVIGAAK